MPAGNPDGGQWTDGDYGGEEGHARRSFNKQKAIQYLISHGKTRSTGWCARHVGDAIEKGGGLFIGARPGKAKNFGSWLEKGGFEPLLSVSEKSEYPPAGYIPQLGDIVVMDTYPTSDNQAGHMAMFIGWHPNKTPLWHSDWRQRLFWANSDYARFGSRYKIYRYP